MGITHHGTTGQTLYARVQTAASTFKGVALTEGSIGGLGVYNVTDAALVSAGLTSSDGDYPYTIRTGSASDTVNDLIVGSGVLGWTGTVEREIAPTTAAITAALLAVTNGSATVAAQLQRLDAAVSSVSAGSSGGPTDQRWVSPEFTVRIPKRSSGVVVASQPIRIKTSESVTVAVDFSSLLVEGDRLATIVSIVTSSGSSITLTALGVDREFGKFTVSGGVAVITYPIVMTVTTAFGDTLEGEFSIVYST